MTKQNINTVIVILVIAVFYGILHVAGITCPIRFVTGISCPGCGMTRAWLSLLKGDLEQAFHYHPLFFLPPVCMVIYLCRKHISQNSRKYLWYFFIFLIFGAYFIRLLNPEDQIVTAQPEISLPARIILKLLSR